MKKIANKAYKIWNVCKVVRYEYMDVFMCQKIKHELESIKAHRITWSDTNKILSVSRKNIIRGKGWAA